MIISHQKEKIIHSIIYFVKKTKYCGLTKLMKLLYYLDFEHFVQTRFSVTGQEYYTYKYGPVPEEVYKCIKNGEKELDKYIVYIPKEDGGLGGEIKIKNKVRFDKKYFSQRELDLLERIAFFYKDMRAKDMTKATHFPEGPWDYTKTTKGMFQKIDYILSLKEEYFKNKLPIEEIQERQEDRKLIRTFFDVSKR
ncbi:MAG: Panacea domain-containing protein [Candidatus Firestonebacteria bacterium]